jgi:hypothetical protein
MVREGERRERGVDACKRKRECKEKERGLMGEREGE